MSSELKTGVYEIRNKVNGKRYVGSTARNFNERWTNHKRNLKNNKHHSPYLQNSWNKYGEESFEFVVLEVIGDEKLCIQREQYWIDYYNSSDCNFGYNVCIKADSCKGITRSEEFKQRLRIANLGNTYAKGAIRTEEYLNKLRKSNSKFTYKITTPENEEITVTSLNEFCKNNNLSVGNMSEVIRGIRKQHKGYKAVKLNELGEI